MLQRKIFFKKKKHAGNKRTAVVIFVGFVSELFAC